MKSLILTLSKTELELGADGKWYYKVVDRKEIDDGGNTRKPIWWDRFLELRKEGKTYAECSDLLNKEGFTSKAGGKVRESSLVALYWYHTKGSKKLA